MNFSRLLPYAVSAALVLTTAHAFDEATAKGMGELTILSIETDRLVELTLERAAGDIRDYLRRSDVRRRGRPVFGEDAISVTIHRPQDFEAALKALSILVEDMRGNDGKIAPFALESNQETGEFVFRLAVASLLETKHDLAGRVARLLRCRMDGRADVVAVSDTTIALWSAEGSDDRSNHSVPDCRPRSLSIHAIDTDPDRAERPGFRSLRDAKIEDKMWLVRRVPVVPSDGMVSVTSMADTRDGRGILDIRLDGVATREFREWTLDNTEASFAVVLDEEVLSVPRLREPILGGSMQLSMELTREEAERLVARLDPIIEWVRFERIATCARTRAEALRDPSC